MYCPLCKTGRVGHLKTYVCSLTESWLSLCDPMDCSPPGSSVRVLLQARILEWVAMPSSRGSSRRVRCSIMPSADISCIVCSCNIWEPMWRLEGATFFQVQNISQPMNNQHRPSVELRALCLMLYSSLDRKRAWGRMDTCCTYGWVSLPCPWNGHNVVNWLYNTK